MVEKSSRVLSLSLEIAGMLESGVKRKENDAPVSSHLFIISGHGRLLQLPRRLRLAALSSSSSSSFWSLLALPLLVLDQLTLNLTGSSSRKFRVPISFVNRRQDACKNALARVFSSLLYNAPPQLHLFKVFVFVLVLVLKGNHLHLQFLLSVIVSSFFVFPQ